MLTFGMEEGSWWCGENDKIVENKIIRSLIVLYTVRLSHVGTLNINNRGQFMSVDDSRSRAGGARRKTTQFQFDRGKFGFKN